MKWNIYIVKSNSVEEMLSSFNFEVGVGTKSVICFLWWPELIIYRLENYIICYKCWVTLNVYNPTRSNCSDLSFHLRFFLPLLSTLRSLKSDDSPFWMQQQSFNRSRRDRESLVYILAYYYYTMFFSEWLSQKRPHLCIVMVHNYIDDERITCMFTVRRSKFTICCLCEQIHASEAALWRKTFVRYSVSSFFFRRVIRACAIVCRSHKGGWLILYFVWCGSTAYTPICVRVSIFFVFHSPFSFFFPPDRHWKQNTRRNG